MIDIADISYLNSKKNTERFINDRYDGDIARFLSDINSTVNKLLQTDLKQVAAFIDRLEPLFRYLPDFHRPRLLAVKARYAHWTGDSRKASRLYRKAVDQLHSVRNYDAAARARQGLMDVYMYLGYYQEALRTGRSALTYFRKKGNEYNAARVMTNIGNIYHRLDHNTMALRYYNRARRYFEKDGGVPLAIIDFNRANIYANLNRLDKAEELYKTVSKRFQEGRMDLAAGKAEYSLAYLYFLEDKYTLALQTFDRVMELFESTGDQKSIAVTQLDLAEINIHLNQFGSAVMHGERALTTCRKLGMRYEQAKTAFFIAEAYRQLRDNQLAARYLNRAEKLFKEENNKLWLGMVNITRARLQMASRRYTEADKNAGEAYAYFQQSGDKRRSIDARITVMEIYLRKEMYKKAIQLGQKLLRNKLVNYQKHNILHCIGQAYLNLSELNRALEYLNRAIAVIEKMLENIYPDEIRFFFAFNKYPTYLSAVNCQLRTKRVKESFLQHSKALALLNKRQLPMELIQKEVPEHLLQAHSELRASLKKLSVTSDGEQRQVVSPKSLYRNEHRLWDTERKIRSYLYPVPSTIPRSGELTGEYTECIADGEVLVNFISVDRKIGAFCVSPDHTRFVNCPVGERELENKLRELHFLMEMSVHSPGGHFRNREVIGSYLTTLYDWLIKPLNLTGNVEKLILLLDGIYAQLPFSAFKDADGRWLKDRLEIEIIINPDDLLNKRRHKKLAIRSRCAVFAPPNSGLPAAIQEGINISKVFPSAKVYMEQEAGIENLRKELKQSGGFVHIATHASRSSENPLFSRIMMSDGPFFPFDLFGTGIKARLITLSGCQTAAPGIYYGNSFSLAKAFYQGGANCVLASLWPISDKISLVFMTEFYTALGMDGIISKAYIKAMNKTCRINDNPAFWSPFVMLGI